MSEDDPQILDATGLRCPMPVLRARKAMKGMVSGTVLEVHATDDAAPKDFESFCRTTGDTLLGIEMREGVHVVKLRKA